MPDVSIIEANKQLFEYGSIGLLAFFAMVYGAFATKQWIDTVRRLNEEKDKRVDDVRQQVAETYTIRQAMEANTTAINTLLNFVNGKV